MVADAMRSASDCRYAPTPCQSAAIGRSARPPTVAIAGGGLAGLSCALSLGLAGAEVTLYEARRTLGGKAGVLPADGALADCPIAVEHGPHFLAGWYLNLRALLRRLHLAERLVDFDGYSVLSPDQRGGVSARHAALGAPSARGLLGAWAATLRHGPLDWALALSCVAFALDLLATTPNAELDERSVAAFIASRSYRDDALLAEVAQQILRAVSVPAECVSSLTIRTMMDLWFCHPRPLLSVLDGDLGSALIDPLARVVGEVASVRTGAPASGLAIQAGRLRGLRLGDGSTAPADVVVCATPVEVLQRWVCEQPAQIDPRLAGLDRLRTAPMAAFLLAFDRPLRVPAGVVHLAEADPAINLIDLSRTWRSLRHADGSVLSVVISDFAKLAHLEDAEATERVLDELARHLPDLRGTAPRHAVALPNTSAPFFTTTVGSWRHRPDPRRRYGVADRGAALHVIGDYVRTPVNLACMEGAVLSGLLAARSICAYHGLEPGLQPILAAGAGAGRRALYRLGAGLLAPVASLGARRRASTSAGRTGGPAETTRSTAAR